MKFSEQVTEFRRTDQRIGKPLVPNERLPNRARQRSVLLRPRCTAGDHAGDDSAAYPPCRQLPRRGPLEQLSAASCQPVDLIPGRPDGGTENTFHPDQR